MDKLLFNDLLLSVEQMVEIERCRMNDGIEYKCFYIIRLDDNTFDIELNDVFLKGGFTSIGECYTYIDTLE